MNACTPVATVWTFRSRRKYVANGNFLPDLGGKCGKSAKLRTAYSGTDGRLRNAPYLLPGKSAGAIQPAKKSAPRKILNADGQRTNVQRAGKSGLMAQRLGISSYWFCVLTREAPLPSGGCRTTVSLKMPFSATTVTMPSYFSAIAELTASQTHVPCRPWSSPAYHLPCSAALHSYSPHATPPCHSWRLP